MTAVFKHRGDAVDYVSEADVAAGAVVVANDLVGVAKLDLKAGKRGALALTGVYAVPKATGEGTALPFGVSVNWDGTNQRATTATGGGEVPLGKVVVAASDTDATVQVRLSQ